jgi:hypothetical protein
MAEIEVKAGGRPRGVSDVVARKRAEEVVRVMIDGAIKSLDIVEYVRQRETQNEPGNPWFLQPDQKPLTPKAIRRYIDAAERTIAEMVEDDLDKIMARHLAQRRGLFQKAVSQGDIRAALAVLQDEAHLLGIYPAKRTEVTGANGGPISLAVLVAAVQQAEQEKLAAPPPIEIADQATPPAELEEIVFPESFDEADYAEEKSQ